MSTYGTDATIKSLSGLEYGDLGFANDAAFDTYIAALNAALSETINTYCSHDFDKHEDDEVTLRGNNSPVLRLPNRPILAINSITVRSASMAVGTGSVISTDDYRIRPVPRSGRNSGSIEHYFRKWYKADIIVVDYDWGYATVPVDVAEITEQLVLGRLRRAARKIDDGDAKSISIGGYSVSYGQDTDEETGFLSQLNKYRSVFG